MRAMGALTSTAAENQALWNLRSRRLCSVRKEAAVELSRLQTYEKLLVYLPSCRQCQRGLTVWEMLFYPSSLCRQK